MPEGSAEDADRAVRAARAAFDSWSQTPAEERARLCGAIGAKLAERGDDIAALITMELWNADRSLGADPGRAALGHVFLDAGPGERDHLGGRGRQLADHQGARRRRRAITPWNYPLYQITAEVAPALAAGCTVVLKPSAVASLERLCAG